MSHDVRVRLRARNDIEDAARWYESQQPNLGGEYLDEVAAAFEKLAENAQGDPEIHRGTRRLLLQRFPFGIFYRINDNAVIVVAVMHSSRDPNNWKTRT